VDHLLGINRKDNSDATHLQILCKYGEYEGSFSGNRRISSKRSGRYGQAAAGANEALPASLCEPIEWLYSGIGNNAYFVCAFLPFPQSYRTSPAVVLMGKRPFDL